MQTTSLSTSEFGAFYKQFRTRHYKKGEILIRSDDDPQGIFCLTKGFIRQYTISKNGMELTLHILKPTSYFPLVWAINGTPNVYYYEALTPVEVGRAPREEVVSFIINKPKIIFQLMSILLDEYAETLSRMEHLVFSDAFRRVISVLVYIAKHFGKQNTNTFVVGHRFTHQDIANLVGVARETVSIEMRRLESEGHIKYVNHAIIFDDIGKLEQKLNT